MPSILRIFQFGLMTQWFTYLKFVVDCLRQTLLMAMKRLTPVCPICSPLSLSCTCNSKSEEVLQAPKNEKVQHGAPPSSINPPEIQPHPLREIKPHLYRQVYMYDRLFRTPAFILDRSEWARSRNNYCVTLIPNPSKTYFNLASIKRKPFEVFRKVEQVFGEDMYEISPSNLQWIKHSCGAISSRDMKKGEQDHHAVKMKKISQRELNNLVSIKTAHLSPKLLNVKPYNHLRGEASNQATISKTF